MISKSKQKYINSLQLKKNRRQEGLFVAEGPKVVGDLMAVAQPKMVVSTNSWLASHKKDLTPQTEIIEVNEKELSHTSFYNILNKCWHSTPFHLKSHLSTSTILNNIYALLSMAFKILAIWELSFE